MEDADKGRGKVMQTAIAALCLETGVMSVEKGALDAMSQLLESYILQVGRRARDYCEVASRTAPTCSDVELALMDVGADLASLSEYSRRPQRRHLPKQIRSHSSQQRRVLQVGSKKQRPLHVSAHLPSFPDPHTYIRTPTFSTPVSDYKRVREKLGTQKRNSRRGLSKLLAKTRPSHPIAGEVDKYGLYTVVTCPPPSSPLYLQALMPTPDDTVDTVANDKLSNDKTPSPTDSQAKLPGLQQSEEPAVPASIEEKEFSEGQELYENPFLKPPKRIRLRPL